MANLSSVLAQAAADHGERPAVRLDDLVLSYSQLRTPQLSGSRAPDPDSPTPEQGDLCLM